MLIRDYHEKSDPSGIRECLIELQDFERSFDPRMPSGDEIVDAYVPNMLRLCQRCSGKVLVADVDGEITGYVSILAKVKSDEIEDGNIEYGLISDLVVLQSSFQDRQGTLAMKAPDHLQQRLTRLDGLRRAQGGFDLSGQGLFRATTMRQPGQRSHDLRADLVVRAQFEATYEFRQIPGSAQRF